MPLNLACTRQYLQGFDFRRLFIEELGWNNPPFALKPADVETKGGLRFRRTPVAVLSGIHVFEVTTSDGPVPDSAGRAAIHTAVSVLAAENLLIFTDAARTQSLWYWVKREAGKSRPREHLFVKGQPGDLFLGKLAAMVVEIGELDSAGHISLTEVTRRLKNALDVEPVVKAFFREFHEQHLKFIELIEGIPDARERRWYASVLLNRLMFVWFLQKKGFLDVGRNSTGDYNYLPRKLAASTASKKGRFFSHFLRDLFFEGFAKPEDQRSPVGAVPLGDIPYLNGGLFLPHGVELRAEGDALFKEPYKKICIPDSAFEDLFALFKSRTWSLDDTPGGNDKEINPDVLGYIFEKYINQKEFGAYYTRPEITEYLCEQTIHQLVLDDATEWTAASAQLHAAGIVKGPAPRRFDNIGDLLLHANGPLCQHLLQERLPRLSLLDPACGSGAFLVAALKTLLNLATGLIGRCEALGHRPVLQWIEHERRQHKAPAAYWLKKKLITENLYGVDLMEEAVEIAKLRLFLALVASAEARDQLEPLPNIEFNLLPGNSLIGLLHVDPTAFESSKSARGGEQARMMLVHETELGITVESTTAPTQKETAAAYVAGQSAAKYAELLREKNRLVDLYRKSTSITQDLAALRAEIEEHKTKARDILDRQLLKSFQALGIEFSQATWDAKKQTEGKPEKRPLKLDDIRALNPFHWAYEFDEIVVGRGGFDAIITNPPWENFKPDAKEFFQKYSDDVTKKAMRLEDFEEKKALILEEDPTVRDAWLEYLGCFPHVNLWFRNAPQYRNQTAIIDGRKATTDLNLYKLFIEQCTHLVRQNGRCGLVIPSGIYTDLGATQLRAMLFGQTRMSGLFCFENRRAIFEGVDSRFKFVVLSFENGGQTTSFPARFMRHDVAELAAFPAEDSLKIEVALVRQLSPNSLAIQEFQSQVDVEVSKRSLSLPMIGADIVGAWKLDIGRELHATGDADLFAENIGTGRLPVYGGKAIHQFTNKWSPVESWALEKAVRKRLLGREPDKGQSMDYEFYRLGFREIAANTNERSLISTLLPKRVFATHKLMLNRPTASVPLNTLTYCCAVFNSFVFDFFVRQRVSTTISVNIVMQLPMPRLTESDAAFRPIVERAARLIGTTEEYDDLIKEIFGPKATHRTHGVADPSERQRLRAELDALIAKLYDLTEDEFAHILTTFPLVDEGIKLETLNTYRDLNRLGQLPATRP